MLLEICFILFFFISIRNVLFWTRLWQLKEYRADRLLTHLHDTNEGRYSVFYSLVTAIPLIAIYFLSIFFDFVSVFFPYFTLIILLFLTAKVTGELIARKIRRPIFTIKALAVVVLSLGIIFFTSLLPIIDPLLWLLVVMIFTPIAIGLVVALLAFPTEVYTDYYLQKARLKRLSLKNLRVIAVSGSYGKSSTKEIIADVLSKKYTVVKTPLSNNTPLAIAKIILKKITNDTEFFIVELGAYKRGEIRQLADVVMPTASVTTAVSDQHLALYGSMQDVVLSELELFNALSKDGTILLNKNSDNMKLVYEKIKNRHVVWFGTGKQIAKHMIGAYNIQSLHKGTTWTYSYDNLTFSLSSPLLGKHTIENILPAIYFGLQYGISIEDIRSVIKKLRPLSKTMERVVLASGMHVIDDTFNASPESVRSAVDYLTLSPKRKILILSPLIELGKNAKERHREIGRILARVDFVYLTNNNFLNDIRQGIQDMKGKTELIVDSYSAISKYLQETLKPGDSVVFEGKEAGIVLNTLL